MMLKNEYHTRAASAYVQLKQKKTPQEITPFKAPRANIHYYHVLTSLCSVAYEMCVASLSSHQPLIVSHCPLCY